MQTAFTIIAYKPSSTDVCRGCVMAEYSSDFEISTTASVEEAAQFVAKFFFANKHLGCNEDGYDITVLVNGRSYPLVGDDDSFEVLLQEQDSLIVARAEEIAADLECKHRARLEEEEKIRLQKEEENERSADLAKLAELKAKYEQS